MVRGGKQSADEVSGYKVFREDHPCLELHDKAIACVNKAGKKYECQELFKAYRSCMKKWRTDKRLEASKS